MNGNLSVILLDENLHSRWKEYVASHPHSAFSHHLGWKNIIEKTYGHKTYYMVAVRVEEEERSVAGVLPLVHIKHPLLTNNLVSLPFLDYGGILADNPEAENSLLAEAIRLARSLRVRSIELRHLEPIFSLKSNGEDKTASMAETKFLDWSIHVRSHKVRMLLALPSSSEMLMKSFKSKLRSQIHKPIKEGLVSKVGGEELVDDFYEVFSTNMRDLGSPVHSKELIVNVLHQFRQVAKIVMIYRNETPVACSLMIGFKDTMSNPWASSLLEYRELSPNMLLYWTMLEYASNRGFKFFDFGRSSVDEGTYHFKEQWGAKPLPLAWYYISNGRRFDSMGTDKTKFNKAISCWQKLPVPITKVIGPMIRKYISL
ncbi:MAG: FemAB family XrtA/PEP-CTERM system-associated protein [Deltaproteobacteria bacterium]